MRSFVFYDDDGTIRSMWSESDFKAFQRLTGKTEQEIDEMISEIEATALRANANTEGVEK